ncbi:MAG: hypothetical protein RSD22_11720 [Romboutsia sp.]
MSNIRSSFENIKGKQVETARFTMKVDSRYHQREPHGIQEGIRKDKKVTMGKKLS